MLERVRRGADREDEARLLERRGRANVVFFLGEDFLGRVAAVDFLPLVMVWNIAIELRQKPASVSGLALLSVLFYRRCQAKGGSWWASWLVA